MVDYRIDLILDRYVDSGSGWSSLDEERNREILRQFLARIELGIYDLTSVQFDNEALHYREHGQGEQQQRHEHHSHQHQQSGQLGGVPAEVIVAYIKDVGIPIFTALLGAFVTKYRRKVRLKVNGIEIETSNIEDLERMIDKVGALSDVTNKSKDNKAKK